MRSRTASSTVANVSRTVIAEAARRFPVRVIEVTAPPDVLAVAAGVARARGCATTSRARLARSVALPDHVPVETVVNDGSLEDGVTRFVAALNRAASGVPG